MHDGSTSSWNGHATLWSGVSGRLISSGQRGDVVRQVGNKIFIVVVFEADRIIDRTEISQVSSM